MTQARNPKRALALLRLNLSRDDLVVAMNHLHGAAIGLRRLTYSSRESFKAMELSNDVTALIRTVDLLIQSGQVELDHEPTEAELKEIG